jgi:hypothetical protein
MAFEIGFAYNTADPMEGKLNLIEAMKSSGYLSPPYSEDTFDTRRPPLEKVEDSAASYQGPLLTVG